MLEKIENYRRILAYLFWINFDREKFIEKKIKEAIFESKKMAKNQKEYRKE